MPTTPLARELAALQAGVAGEVVLPGAPAYDDARRPVVARFHHVRPRAVVRCAGPDDVVAALAVARLLRLPAAVRSGGHCAAGRSTTTGLLLDVAPMHAVELRDGVVTVGAGARLGAVYDALAGHGLTVPAGCGPTVGIAGLTLGGGFGLLGRLHGLTCDNLLGARVVCASGVVDCDAHRDPDLFWALRGGGAWGAGGSWVVTALRFAPVAAPRTTTFRWTWPAARAAPVVAAWPRWAPAAPPELAATLRLVAPADPDAPAALHLEGALLGGDPAPLLAGLVERTRSEPVSATTASGSYREAKRTLAGLGGVDAPGVRFSRSEFFRRPFPHAAAAALVESVLVHRVAGHEHEVALTPWAGAYNRPTPDATAFAHRGESYLVENGLVVAPEEAGHARRRLARSWATIGPWGTGRVYPNFPDPDRALPGRAYHAGNHERLRRIRAAHQNPRPH